MEDKQNFETAFHRLENILEKMNTESVSLDEALKLYEEADTLITGCQKQLSDAERRIEVLLKNRDGTLTLDETAAPLTESFENAKSHPLSR